MKMSHTNRGSETGLLHFFSGRTKFFKATLQKRDKISSTKILTKSTDFDINIFLI